jgi:hypothetical protein
MNEWPEEMIIGKRIGSKFVGASFVSRKKAQWDIQAKQKIKNKKIKDTCQLLMWMWGLHSRLLTVVMIMLV